MSDLAPITRDEYERRHAEMQERYERFARRSMRILKGIFVVLLVVGAVTGYLVQQNTQRSEESTHNAKVSTHLSHELINNAVDACQQNGNGLRKTVREYGQVIADEKIQNLARTRAFVASGFYQKALPQLSPRDIQKLIEEQIHRTGSEVKRIDKAKKRAHPINCKRTYAPSDQPKR